MNENEALMMKVMAELAIAKAPIIFKGAMNLALALQESSPTVEGRNLARNTNGLQQRLQIIKGLQLPSSFLYNRGKQQTEENTLWRM